MLVRLLRALRDRPAVVIALAVGFTAAGCGYTSQYQPPPSDGRARPVWRDSDVGVDTGGLAVTAECWDDVGRLNGRRDASDRAVRVAAVEGGYWAPRYYGDPIVIVNPGIVPRLLRPPLFVPRIVLEALRASSRVTVGGPPTMGGGGGRGMRLGGGGGGGGDMGKAAIVLVLAAVVVMAIIGLVLAIDQPESSASGRAIDEVNGLNDLARMPGTSCSTTGGAP